jgi:hypothetical protein
MSESKYVTDTSEHESARLAFLAGKNILITGPAGTGKSVLTKRLIEMSQSTPLQCATTGTASLLLGDNGRTVHNLLRMSTDYLTLDDLKRQYKSHVNSYHKSSYVQFFKDHDGARKLFKAKFPQADTKDYLTSDVNFFKEHPLWWQKFQKEYHDQIVSDDLEWVASIRKAKVIIVDECSMLSAWMMEAIDVILCEIRECYHKPWGGLQVVFVGDFAQLPPVYPAKDTKVPHSQGDFAFQSAVWSALQIEVHALTQVFRQEDSQFAALLQSVRYRIPFTPEQNEMLAKMKIPHAAHESVTYVNGNKAKVAQYNEQKYQDLNTIECEYEFPYHQIDDDPEEYKQLLKNVCDCLHLNGSNQSDFPPQCFKIGMKVMITRNIRHPNEEKPYLVNGDTGVIVCFQKPSPEMMRRLPDFEQQDLDRLYPVVAIDRKGGKEKCQLDEADHRETWVPPDDDKSAEALILPTRWERTRVHFNYKLRTFEEECLASISAIPLIPCWAMTAHKLQGQTLDRNVKLHIDAEGMEWQKGTFYVALSRARSVSQVYITNYRNYAQHSRAIEFYRGQYVSPSAKTYQYQDRGEARNKILFEDLPPLEAPLPLDKQHLEQQHVEQKRALESSPNTAQPVEPKRSLEASPNTMDKKPVEHQVSSTIETPKRALQESPTQQKKGSQKRQLSPTASPQRHKKSKLSPIQENSSHHPLPHNLPPPGTLSVDCSLSTLENEFHQHMVPLMDQMWFKYQNLKKPKKRYSELLALCENWCRQKKNLPAL